MLPCPQLERSGGIWRFAADTPMQDQVRHGTRYATGIRNVVALAWHPRHDALYFAMHGRDQLDTLWPADFTTGERIMLPAEEFHRAERGDDFGWPYTYYDGRRNQRMVAPEYGGNGEEVAEGGYETPLLAFPAHWAPNALAIYVGTQFPERFRGGAFIAFHGSWNRAPASQAGFNVAFVPLDASGRPAGNWEIFATGFAGKDEVLQPGEAQYRPTGLAAGPDGALYISDSQQGRIWRVTYSGG
jgi:glucose/arabinose dehydrogenase